MRDLAGKVAVITGAGGGIGAALAHAFAREGMRIVVSDIDERAAAITAADIASGGGEAISARVDVARQQDLDDLANRAWDRFGSVDILCNNAGIVPSGRYRPVWEFPLEDWRWALDVNLMGVVHGLRSFMPRMIAQNSEGHVVTTASVAGLVSGSGSAVYSASKHGAVRATEALYASLQEMGSPIGVTLLCPGLVNTSIYNSERNRPAGLMPEQGVAEETAELQSIADSLYRDALSPGDVAAMVIKAIRNQQFYLLTSDNFDAPVRERFEALLARRNPHFSSLLDLSKGDVGEKGAA